MLLKVRGYRFTAPEETTDFKRQSLPFEVDGGLLTQSKYSIKG